MARGFESKDVEYQQAEAERGRRLAPPLAPAERDRAADRRTLELALVRARAEHASTASAVRREMLARAIADLESRIAASTDPAQ